MALAVAVARSPGVAAATAVLAALVVVVLVRAGDTPTARLFPGYLVLGAGIVLARVVFHVLVGIKPPGTVLLDLPTVRAPDWAVGVHLLGPVTTTGLATAATAGLQLATLVICFGAASALADPRRALRSLPAAMHHLGTAVVIAVSVTPQLVTAAAAVRRAQRLRGTPERGWRGLASTALPVLTDALDRSLALAASMDVRGFARTTTGHRDRRVGPLLAVSLVALAVGGYGLLADVTPWRAVALVTLGTAAGAAGVVVAGRGVRSTRYRPDRWRRAELRVAGAGAGAAAVLLLVPALLGDAARSPLVPLLAFLTAALPALHAGGRAVVDHQVRALLAGAPR
jgi:energy-coupling factor transport system permease protein